MANNSTSSTIQNTFYNYLDTIPNSILLLDFAYQIQFINQTAMLSLKSSELMTSSLKTIFDLVAPHYHSVLQSSLDDVAAMITRQKEVVCTLRIPREDIFVILTFHHFTFGEFSGIQIRLQSHNLNDKQKIPFKVISNDKSLEDIFRKLVHQEQELADSQQRYRIISENSHDLVTLYDTAFNFSFVSPSIINYGQVPAEFVGRNFFEVFEYEPSFCTFFEKEIFEPLLQHKTKLVGPLVIKRMTDKGERDLELVAKPIFDEKDNLTFILTTEQDVTERIKAASELKEAFKKEKHLNELKSQFVSMASHQFRTPLSVIRANMELFEMLKFELPQTTVKRAERIINRTQSEVSRLTSMINDVLILGRLDAAKTPFRPAFIDLVMLCQMILTDEFDAETDNRKGRLITQGKPQKVWCDKNLMFHAIVNLVSNAFKYSQKAPEPIIELTFQTNTVRIAVIDFGIGIEKNELSNLFQSFYRSQNVLNIEGTGLGLVIAKEFVELHDGFIEVESTINVGSKFVIELPINTSKSKSTD